MLIPFVFLALDQAEMASVSWTSAYAVAEHKTSTTPWLHLGPPLRIRPDADQCSTWKRSTVSTERDIKTALFQRLYWLLRIEAPRFLCISGPARYGYVIVYSNITEQYTELYLHIAWCTRWTRDTCQLQAWGGVAPMCSFAIPHKCASTRLHQSSPARWPNAFLYGWMVSVDSHLYIYLYTMFRAFWALHTAHGRSLFSSNHTVPCRSLPFLFFFLQFCCAIILFSAFFSISLTLIHPQLFDHYF
jgi:hypothetical protein